MKAKITLLLSVLFGALAFAQPVQQIGNANVTGNLTFGTVSGSKMAASGGAIRVTGGGVSYGPLYNVYGWSTPIFTIGSPTASVGNGPFDSTSVLELVPRAGMPDLDNIEVSEIDFTTSLTSSTPKVVGIEVYLSGSVAGNRGGHLLIDTKADGGALVNAIDINNQQRVLFPRNFLLNGTATFVNVTDAGVGSGAFVLSGGASFAKKVRVEDTTAASALGTASVVFMGGLSVAGQQYVGGNMFVAAGGSGGSLTLGASVPTADGNTKVYMLGSNAQTNWLISSNNVTPSALEFIPSTAGGGTTFTTPTFKLLGTGATLTGTATVGGLTSTGAILGSGGTAPTTSTSGSNQFTVGLATNGPFYAGSTISVADTIVSTRAGGAILNALSGTTGPSIINIQNTSGYLTVGLENSTGGNQFSGTAAYSGVVGTQVNKDFWLGTNAVGRVRIPGAGGLAIGATSTVLGILTATATLDFGSILVAASEDKTITVTGAAVGDTVAIGTPATVLSGAVFNGWVSSANTVTIRCNNAGSIAVDPASAIYRATVIQF